MTGWRDEAVGDGGGIYVLRSLGDEMERPLIVCTKRGLGFVAGR